MNKTLIKNMEQMKIDGVTLSEIYEELDYRDQADCNSRWNDNLYEYSTSELEQIASWWNDKEEEE